MYVRVWQRKRLILVPKSRRMSMSWTNIALIVWDCLFHLGRNWAMVSKKESDSDELLERAKFIIENLDHDIVPKEIIPKFNKTYCNLKLPEVNSQMMGFASGADQLRQFTFSGIMADEMAFWDNAEDMYSASYPTIEGKNENEGGKFIGISSPAPGFFEKMVFDKLDEAELEGDPDT
jgi:phage terminase large subunit-like protein